MLEESATMRAEGGGVPAGEAGAAAGVPAGTVAGWSGPCGMAARHRVCMVVQRCIRHTKDTHKKTGHGLLPKRPKKGKAHIGAVASLW
jgi:hypothetical protein